MGSEQISYREEVDAGEGLRGTERQRSQSRKDTREREAGEARGDPGECCIRETEKGKCFQKGVVSCVQCYLEIR